MPEHPRRSFPNHTIGEGGIRLPKFDQAALAAIRAEALQLNGARQKTLKQLARREQTLQRDIDNLTAFIRKGDSTERVRAELKNLEQELSQVRYDRRQLGRQPQDAIEVPDIAEIRILWQETDSDLAIDRWKFCKLMRRLIPRIEVFPHRLCDGGRIVLRARFRLMLSQLLPDARLQEALPESWEKVLTLDLYDPPQREMHRERVLSLRGHLSEKQAAAESERLESWGRESNTRNSDRDCATWF